MRTRLLTVACLLACVAPALAGRGGQTPARAAQAIDLSGRWDVSITREQGSQSAPMELKKARDKFVGVFYTPQGNADVTATLEDEAVAFVLSPFPTPNGPVTATMNGTVEGDTMAGTLVAGDRTLEWTARRTPAAGAAPAASSDTSVDLTGTWALEVATPNGTGHPTLVLEQTGGKLSGHYSSTYGEYTVTGTVTGNEFTFSIPMGVEGNTIDVIYTGSAAKATMKGTVTLGERGEGTFVGKKK